MLKLVVLCSIGLMLIQSDVWGQVDCKPSCIQIAARRINPGEVPEEALVAPDFFPANELQPYGSTIKLISTKKASVGSTVEYSNDNGQTWIAGQELTLVNTGVVQARLRVGSRISPVTQAKFTPYFQRIYILGNSISSISSAPSIGWFGNWGMAASAPEKDYVHILSSRLRERYPAIELKILGNDFERNFWGFDFESEEFTKHLAFGPDLIIVRISENINDGEVANRDFEGAYRKLLERLVSFSGPVKVVCTTSFWPNQSRSNAIIRKVAQEKGYPVADLNVLAGKPMYQAHEFFTNIAVGDHPGDLGMQAIADLIWEKVR